MIPDDGAGTPKESVFREIDKDKVRRLLDSIGRRGVRGRRTDHEADNTMPTRPTSARRGGSCVDTVLTLTAAGEAGAAIGARHGTAALAATASTPVGCPGAAASVGGGGGAGPRKPPIAAAGWGGESTPIMDRYPLLPVRVPATTDVPPSCSAADGFPFRGGM